MVPATHWNWSRRGQHGHCKPVVNAGLGWSNGWSKALGLERHCGCTLLRAYRAVHGTPETGTNLPQDAVGGQLLKEHQKVIL